MSMDSQPGQEPPGPVSSHPDLAGKRPRQLQGHPTCISKLTTKQPFIYRGTNRNPFMSKCEKIGE